MVGPFMTDEKEGVVRMVHLMYRCNKGFSPGRISSNFMLWWWWMPWEFEGGLLDEGHSRFGCLDAGGRCRDARDGAEKRGRVTFGSEGKSVSIS